MGKSSGINHILFLNYTLSMKKCRKIQVKCIKNTKVSSLHNIQRKHDNKLQTSNIYSLYKKTLFLMTSLIYSEVPKMKQSIFQNMCNFGAQLLIQDFQKIKTE